MVSLLENLKRKYIYKCLVLCFWVSYLIHQAFMAHRVCYRTILNSYSKNKTAISKKVWTKRHVSDCVQHVYLNNVYNLEVLDICVSNMIKLKMASHFLLIRHLCNVYFSVKSILNYCCAFSTVTSMVVAWITVMEGNTSKHLMVLWPVE